MASEQEEADLREALRRSRSSYYNHTVPVSDAVSDAVPADVIAESIALAESEAKARRDAADLAEGIRQSLLFDNTVPGPAPAESTESSDDEFFDAPDTFPPGAGSGAVSGRGIRNYGNTCYFNAAIQAFSAIPGVIATLAAIRLAGAPASDNCARYATAFANLVAAARARGKTGPVTDSAAACLGSVRDLAALTGTYSFPAGRQSDSSEVFRFMIEALQDCTNPGQDWSVAKQFRKSTEAENLQLASAAYANVEFNIANDLTRLFLGCYVETTYAPRVRTEPVRLSLADPATGVSASAGIDVTLSDFGLGTLESALRIRFGRVIPPPSENAVASTHERIWELPAVLVFRLTRERVVLNEEGRPTFLPDGTIQTEVDASPVTFPIEGLDMTPYLHPSSPYQTHSRESRSYRLCAVIDRPRGFGSSVNSGHYTAVTRQPGTSSSWNTYDDATVSHFDFSDRSKRRSIFNTAVVLVYATRQRLEFA
jgi:hypothetical protein